jgi:hypothetical protein
VQASAVFGRSLRQQSPIARAFELRAPVRCSLGTTGNAQTDRCACVRQVNWRDQDLRVQPRFQQCRGPRSKAVSERASAFAGGDFGLQRSTDSEALTMFPSGASPVQAGGQASALGPTFGSLPGESHQTSRLPNCASSTLRCAPLETTASSSPRRTSRCGCRPRLLWRRQLDPFVGHVRLPVISKRDDG